MVKRARTSRACVAVVAGLLVAVGLIGCVTTTERSDSRRIERPENVGDAAGARIETALATQELEVRYIGSRTSGGTAQPLTMYFETDYFSPEEVADAVVRLAQALVSEPRVARGSGVIVDVLLTGYGSSFRMHIRSGDLDAIDWSLLDDNPGDPFMIVAVCNASSAYEWGDDRVWRALVEPALDDPNDYPQEDEFPQAKYDEAFLAVMLRGAETVAFRPRITPASSPEIFTTEGSTRVRLQVVSAWGAWEDGQIDAMQLYEVGATLLPRIFRDARISAVDLVLMNHEGNRVAEVTFGRGDAESADWHSMLSSSRIQCAAFFRAATKYRWTSEEAWQAAKDFMGGAAQLPRSRGY